MNEPLRCPIATQVRTPSSHTLYNTGRVDKEGVGMGLQSKPKILFSNFATFIQKCMKDSHSSCNLILYIRRASYHSN